MLNNYYSRYIYFTMIVLLGCSLSGKEKTSSSTFKDYWYQGKAEITTYNLQQARYGEVHQGTAVMVFVTEDMSKKKQVKLDHPEKHKKDAVSVLKLNAIRDFSTGIYDYDMMTSVFTPVDRNTYPYSFKVTNTSQEWCGQTFTQINKTDNGYKYRLFSYFESEGDQKHDFEQYLLEDELWNIIRIDPETLPTGTHEIIPGTVYQRLSHTEVKPYTAEIKKDTSQDAIVDYTIRYPELERTLEIRYEKDSPHHIQSWVEKQQDGDKELITKAVRDKSIMTDYWNKNKLKDASYRTKLNLR